eukprot:TRINITY_DN6369_c0_g1_i1.p1 TRINITY_DN6369_c0_g1~~TRINITY_DN6369_c0_g1_i1.p1  ORF type:complete len:448 (-),score=170.81 TRINITY_DN6369_c0_g1_i1:80-1423(-)
MVSKDPVFSNLSADDINSEPTEIESMCMNCHKDGVTKLLLTLIPHYKEIILMSFNCEHCGLSNNEIQSGGVIQEKGLKLTVTISNERDLSRQLVKSDYATLTIPELELEIPPKGQKGEITTVEGVMERTISGLEQDQPVRRHMDPEGAKQIDDYIVRMRATLKLAEPFTVLLDDPSGNSFIENPTAPGPDPGRTSEQYTRTTEQDHALAIYTQEELKTSDDPVLARVEEEEDTALTEEKLKEEILTFPTNCHNCNAPAETNMKMTNIPYFKEVVIMATVCDMCGIKTNEVKAGGGIEPKGKKITLKVTDPTDMSRDVLKSETCSIAIPELEFEMGGHALGGRFTTLEGLMNNVLESIEQNSVWGGGDGVAPDINERMSIFKLKFQDCVNASMNFTVVLDDPAGNSYMQNVYAPEEDPELTIETYERSFDQNEDLGLNDMKVEGYEES